MGKGVCMCWHILTSLSHAVCRICSAHALRSVMQRVASYLRHTKTYRQLLADDMKARRG